MYSIMQAAKMLDSAFPWLTEEDAAPIVTAYAWAVHARAEPMLLGFDIERMKAIILVWLNQSSNEAHMAVTKALEQLS